MRGRARAITDSWMTTSLPAAKERKVLRGMVSPASKGQAEQHFLFVFSLMTKLWSRPAAPQHRPHFAIDA